MPALFPQGCSLLIGCLSLPPLLPEKQAASPPPAPPRTFLFTYAAVATGLKPVQAARAWLPVPSAAAEQDVEIVSQELPARGRFGREPEYGNRMLYLEARADAEGKIPLKVVYRVTRREVRGPLGKDEDTARVERALRADARVPLDGKPRELLRGKELPEDRLAAARVLYDVVLAHMRYSKEGTGWGRGDAVWACENGRGNCSDFHSLFISLARSEKIPARFEIGFSLPAKAGRGPVTGYHCWALFRPGRLGWVPVDISEASKDPGRRDYYFGNLTPDRVTFSTGRDLTLVPKQDGPPLNFFIQPYLEVDGKPYPADRVTTSHTFQDEPGR